MNAGAWGHPLPAAHWALVLAYGAETVRCAEEAPMPRERFERGRRAYAHAAVTLHPQGKPDPPRAAIATA